MRLCSQQLPRAPRTPPASKGAPGGSVGLAAAPQHPWQMEGGVAPHAGVSPRQGLSEAHCGLQGMRVLFSPPAFALHAKRTSGVARAREVPRLPLCLSARLVARLYIPGDVWGVAVAAWWITASAPSARNALKAPARALAAAQSRLCFPTQQRCAAAATMLCYQARGGCTADARAGAPEIRSIRLPQPSQTCADALVAPYPITAGS